MERGCSSRFRRARVIRVGWAERSDAQHISEVTIEIAGLRASAQPTRAYFDFIDL